MDWFSRLKMKQRNELYRDPAIADYKRADDRLEQLSERSRRVPNKSDVLALAKKDYGEHLLTYTNKPIRFNTSLIHETRNAGAPTNKDDDSDYDSDAASISSSVSENSQDDSKKLAAKRKATEAIQRATKTGIRLQKASEGAFYTARSDHLYGKWKTENKEKRSAVAELKKSGPTKASGVRRKLEAALSLGTPSKSDGGSAKHAPVRKAVGASVPVEMARVLERYVDDEIKGSEKLAAEVASGDELSTVTIASHVVGVIARLGEKAKRWMVTKEVAKELQVPQTPALKQRIQDVIDTKRGKAPSTHAPPPTTETAKKALADAGLMSYNELQKAITKRYGKLSATKRKEILDKYKVVKAAKEREKKKHD